jgi:hypothetical protein
MFRVVFASTHFSLRDHHSISCGSESQSCPLNLLEDGANADGGVAERAVQRRAAQRIRVGGESKARSLTDVAQVSRLARVGVCGGPVTTFARTCLGAGARDRAGGATSRRPEPGRAPKRRRRHDRPGDIPGCRFRVTGRRDVAIASALRRCPSGPAGAGAISLRSIPGKRAHPAPGRGPFCEPLLTLTKCMTASKRRSGAPQNAIASEEIR